MNPSSLPRIPAAFFGMVLGLAGLGGTWRAAAGVWPLPAAIGETIMAVAVLVWAVLVVLYGLKWLVARPVAEAEVAHPIQCCFVGLVGVATMLVAGAVLPYARPLAVGLFGAGSLFTLAFAIWRTGGLWQGGRDPGSTTAVLYLPSVAGSFVAAALAGALGYPDWGQLALGAGVFAWLAIESVLLHRLLTGPTLPAALRPTLGIQLAPAVVGANALIAVAPEPGFLAHMMLGYGLLQCLVLLRLWRWIAEEAFTPAYWAFTFGATALATAPLRLIALGDAGAITVLAPPLFVLANLVVGLVALGTVWRLAQGRLLPAAPAPQPAPGP